MGAENYKGDSVLDGNNGNGHGFWIMEIPGYIKNGPKYMESRLSKLNIYTTCYSDGHLLLEFQPGSPSPDMLQSELDIYGFKLTPTGNLVLTSKVDNDFYVRMSGISPREANEENIKNNYIRRELDSLTGGVLGNKRVPDKKEKTLRITVKPVGKEFAVYEEEIKFKPFKEVSREV